MSNPLCHFELMTDDPQKCKAFFGKVFDWNFDEHSIPGYTLIKTGAEPTGGVFPRPAEAPAVCVNIYFSVEDIDATIAKVTDNGGTVIVPKTAIPNIGHFAMFAAPEGIVIGIMQPAGEAHG